MDVLSDVLRAVRLTGALFFDVDPNLTTRHRVDYVRMFADGRLERSADFPGEVFA